MTSTQFKDRHGKTWDMKINLGKALMVDRSDFTMLTHEKIILSRYDQDSLKVIITDTAVLFAVIGVLVRGDCKDNFGFEINDETTEDQFQSKFVESIDGSCLEPARTAFVEALGDFFPAAKTVLSSFLQKIVGYQEKVSTRLTTEILPMMDQEMDNLLDDEMNKLKKTLQGNRNATSSP